ncbi:hypothetical protein J1N35_008090 [Gossypium stocksii]|uniref:RRM domain-containing protein n=1 Tax=Gossypium stocksii TaxID=47602 RepID=A0A9D3W863_9ROSI|nr:hypothetical protein J1N35_008090 [Gossypium stocksii]
MLSSRRKKSKSGKRFSFVRFSNFTDAQRAILRLNGFVILGSKIWVKFARFNERRHIWRKVHSHRESLVFKDSVKDREVGENKRKGFVVVKEKTWDDNTSDYRRNVETSLRKENQSKVVQGHIEEEHLWKLQKCLIGEVASFCETRIIEDRVARMGLGEISVKRIQGNFFLIEIPDEVLFDILKQRDWSYLKEFFISIIPWSKKFVYPERVTWIEISGVPIHCWNYETFKRVAGVWGNVVSMRENFTKTSNYEKMGLLVLVSRVSKIEEVVLLEVEDKRYPIRVSEQGWSKDLNINLSNRESRQRESCQVEVKESVSESRSAIGLEPEIFSEGN